MTKLHTRIQEDAGIKLLVLWVSLILTYLLDFIIRICNVNFIIEEMKGKRIHQDLLMGITLFIIIPVVFISLLLAQKSFES